MKKKFPRLAAVAATLATAALVLVGCEGSGGLNASSGTGQKLKVGIISITPDASISIARQEKYFEKLGIDVETTVTANPAAGIAAAQSGELDITYTPSIPYINSLSQGVELDIVGAADGYSSDSYELAQQDPMLVDDTGLMVAPHAKDSINTPKDLEGKTISVPARNAQLEVTIADIVQQDGGDPGKIKWIVLDPTSAVQSLEQGRIDAAGLIAPFTSKAESEGSEYFLAPGIEFFQKGAVGLWVSSPKTIESKGEQIQAFHDAMVEANTYANAHQEEAQELAAELTGQPLEVVQEGADTFWPVTVEVEDLQRTADSLYRLGFIDKEVYLNENDLIAFR